MPSASPQLTDAIARAFRERSKKLQAYRTGTGEQIRVIFYRLSRETVRRWIGEVLRTFGFELAGARA